MLSALIPSAGRKPAVPLAGQLAHESCVRPGPLVLGTAFLRFPTAAPDRDRTVSRMFSRITTGIDYTFTLFLGAGVSWRPCLVYFFDAIPSLWQARKSLQGHNTPLLRRYRSTSTADIRFVFE